MKRGVLATSHFVHWRCARNALKEKFISAASQLLSLTHVLNKGFLCRCDLPPSRMTWLVLLCQASAYKASQTIPRGGAVVHHKLLAPREVMLWACMHHDTRRTGIIPDHPKRWCCCAPQVAGTTR
eukprot:1160483-Pelagomonas_calceolata.AAC.1